MDVHLQPGHGPHERVTAWALQWANLYRHAGGNSRRPVEPGQSGRDRSATRRAYHAAGRFRTTEPRAKSAAHPGRSVPARPEPVAAAAVNGCDRPVSVLKPSTGYHSGHRHFVIMAGQSKVLGFEF